MKFGKGSRDQFGQGLAVDHIVGGPRRIDARQVQECRHDVGESDQPVIHRPQATRGLPLFGIRIIAMLALDS